MFESPINNPALFCFGIALGSIVTILCGVLRFGPYTFLGNTRYCTTCPLCVNSSSSGYFAETQSSGLHVERVLSPIVETPDGSYLGYVQPVYELQNGRMKFPAGIKRLAIDVGTSLLSPSSRLWYDKFPDDLMVLAFEPNKFSHSLIAYTSHPTMALRPRRFVFFSMQCKLYQGQRIGRKLVQWYTNCMNMTFGHLIKNRKHFWPANVALSNVNGFAPFNLGVGDPGVASLYEFKPGTEWTQPEKRRVAFGHSYVPKVRLESILQYVPEGITFELLKIDAQGHDAEVVAGAGKFLSTFKCVIGEFDTTAYADADHKGFDYRQILQTAGFRMAGDGVWLNSRFEADFRARNYLCAASDVKPSHDSLLQALTRP